MFQASKHIVTEFEPFLHLAISDLNLGSIVLKMITNLVMTFHDVLQSLDGYLQSLLDVYCVPCIVM
jgi:hypothetical protein